MCRKYLLSWKFFRKTQKVFLCWKFLIFISLVGLLIKSNYFSTGDSSEMTTFPWHFQEGENINHFASSFNKLLTFSWHTHCFLAFIFSLQPRSLEWDRRTQIVLFFCHFPAVLRFPLWSSLAKWSWSSAARRWLLNRTDAPQQFYAWEVPNLKPNIVPNHLVFVSSYCLKSISQMCSESCQMIRPKLISSNVSIHLGCWDGKGNLYGPNPKINSERKQRLLRSWSHTPWLDCFASFNFINSSAEAKGWR